MDELTLASFLDATVLASFFTLLGLEIILGIDNVIFIALLVQHLPRAKARTARTAGLALAMVFRILILLGLAWIMGLTQPVVSVAGHGFSGRDLLMLLGGLFLIYKATGSMREELLHEEAKELKASKGALALVIGQIIVIDIVFSFDSVITAVGMTDIVPVIIAAMVGAMLVMLLCSAWVSDFINTYPTLKMLALAFILLVGVLLMAEGFGFHLPRGYIYFAMAFSLGVESMNILAAKKKASQR